MQAQKRLRRSSAAAAKTMPQREGGRERASIIHFMFSNSIAAVGMEGGRAERTASLPLAPSPNSAHCKGNSSHRHVCAQFRVDGLTNAFKNKFCENRELSLLHLCIFRWVME